MLSQNTRKTKFGVEILIIMLFTKCDRRQSSRPLRDLSGRCLVLYLVTLHFMQSSGWRIGKRLLGAVYYMIIKEM